MTKGVFLRRIYERKIVKKGGEYHVGSQKYYVASEIWDYNSFMDQDHPFAKRMREAPEEDERLGLMTYPIYQSNNSFDIDGEPYFLVFDRAGKRPKRIVYVSTEFCTCNEPDSDEQAISEFTIELKKLKAVEKAVKKELLEQEDAVRISLERMCDQGKVPQQDAVSAFIAEYNVLKEKKKECFECRIEIENTERRIRYHKKCIGRGNRANVLIPQTGYNLICL